MRAVVLGCCLALASACGRFGFDEQRVQGEADATPDDAMVPETCELSSPLRLEGGGIVTGATVQGVGSYEGSCGGVGAAEGTVAIDLAEPVAGLRVAADLPAAGFDNVLYVRDACDDAGTELGCDLTGGVGSSGQLRFGALDSGTYFAFVDGEMNDAFGDFVVEVTVLRGPDEACSGANALDRCLPELECREQRCQPADCLIGQTITGSAVVNGTTIGQRNVRAGSCGEGDDGGERAPETLYALTLATAVTNVNLSTDSAATDFDTLVYIRDGCTGSEIACDDDSGANNRSVLDTGPLAAGDYVIVVDGFAYRSGDFELTVAVTR